MNIRAETDVINWPPRDEHIGIMIQDALNYSKDAKSFETLCILIFRALFRKLKAKMEGFAKNRNTEGVVNMWNSLYTRNLQDQSIQGNRKEFFREMHEDYRNLKEEVRQCFHQCLL
jgi:hypothetical protein